MSSTYNSGPIGGVAGIGEQNDEYTSTLHGKIGTDIEMSDRSLFDILVADGPVIFPEAANISDNVSLAAAIRAILTSITGSDNYDNFTNISNSPNPSLNAIFQKFAAIFAADDSNIFNPVIQGSERTNLELALAALATYITASGSALSIQLNNNPARTNLEQVWEDFTTVIGCNGTNVFNPTIQGSNRTNLKSALAAIATYFTASGSELSIQTNNNLPKTNLEDIWNDFLAIIGCDGSNVFSPSINGSTHATLEAALTAIGTIVGDPSSDTLTSITAKLGNLARNLATILGARWNASGDISTDIATIIADIATLQSTIDSDSAALSADTDTIITNVATLQTTLDSDFTSLDADLATITADTEKIYDASLGSTPVDGSLASFIATGGTELGTRLPASTSLYDTVKVISSVGITSSPVAKSLSDILHKDASLTYDKSTDSLEAISDAVATIPKSTSAGVLQIAATTENLNQTAGTYDLFTATSQPVMLEKLTFALPNVDVSDDITITSISIQTNHTTVQTIISSNAGAKANLTAEAQLSWSGSIYLPVGKKIQLTIAGGAADVDTVCNIIASYRAVSSGGVLSI